MVRRATVAGWLVVAAVAAVAEAAVRLFAFRDSVAAPSAALSALARELESGRLSGAVGTTLDSYAESLALAVVAGFVPPACHKASLSGGPTAPRCAKAILTGRAGGG